MRRKKQRPRRAKTTDVTDRNEGAAMKACVGGFMGRLCRAALGRHRKARAQAKTDGAKVEVASKVMHCPNKDGGLSEEGCKGALRKKAQRGRQKVRKNIGFYMFLRQRRLT